MSNKTQSAKPAAQKYQGEFVMTYGFRELQNGEYRLICDLGENKLKNGKVVAVKRSVPVSFEAIKRVIGQVFPGANWTGEGYVPTSWQWQIIETEVIGEDIFLS